MPPTTTTTKASLIADQVGREIGRLARHLQRAAEAGERGAERKHGGEQHRLIDAERADHFAVLRRRAHQPAEARARQREMQRQQHQRADDDQEQVVARQLAAEHFDRAAQAGRARPEQIFRAPQPERGVVDDQHQREGGEQLEQFGRAIDPPQQHDLDQRADGADDERGGDDAAPEAERAADPGGERIGDVGPQHIEGPVRDIDDAGDAEDQRQADGDKEQAGRGGQPVERLEQECVESHLSRAASRSSPLPLWERVARAEAKPSASRVRGPSYRQH